MMMTLELAASHFENEIKKFKVRMERMKTKYNLPDEMEEHEWITWLCQHLRQVSGLPPI